MVGKRTPLILALVMLFAGLRLGYLDPTPVHADITDIEIEYETCTLPNGEQCFPSGPEELPVRASVQFRFWTGCPSVWIDWGDGRNQGATQVDSWNSVKATHAYEKADEYTIRATDQCDRTMATLTVAARGGGLFGILDLGNPLTVAGVLAAMGGAAILALAFAPLSQVPTLAGSPAGAAGNMARHITAPAPPGGGATAPRIVPVPQPGRTGGPPTYVPPPTYIGTAGGGPGYYTTSTPDPPPVSTTGEPSANGPPFIQGGEAQPIGGAGASVAIPDVGPLTSLTATWSPGSGALTWQTPQYDPSRSVLLRYDISVLSYGPNSTLPVPRLIGNAPPGANTFTVGANQTYVHSTGGDIYGFRVDPVLQTMQGNGPVIVRPGGLLVRFGQVIGT